MRLVAARLVLVAAFVGVATASQEVPAGAAENCDRAEQLAGFDLSAARTAYLELLAGDDPPRCARRGFDDVASKQIEVATLVAQARDAVAVDELDEAVGHINDALALDPANDDAHALLEELAVDEPEEQPDDDLIGFFRPALILHDAGYEDEARTLAREIVQSDAFTAALSEAAPEDLAEVLPDDLQEPDPSTVEWIEDRTADLGKVAIAAAVLLLVGALLLRFAAWVVRRRSVTLGTFVMHPGDGAEEDEKKPDATAMGAVLKAAVAAELADQQRSVGTFRNVDAAGVDLPELVEVPEQLKPVASAVQVLLRRPILTVSAEARRLDDGWHVTAQVAGRRRVAEQESFSVPDEAGTGVDVVGVWVAAWATFALQSNIGWRWRRSRLYPFGTDSWKSAAWVRCASRQDPSSSARTDALHRALLEDHGNVTALALLGSDQTNGVVESDDFTEGLEHLRVAEKVLVDRPTRSARWLRGKPRRTHLNIEPLWFQIRYAQSIARLHRAHKLGADPSAEIPGVKELVQAIAATTLTMSDRWHRFIVSGARRAELRRMLDRDDEYHLGVLAGALAATSSVKPVKSVAYHPAQPGRTWDPERWLRRRRWMDVQARLDDLDAGVFLGLVEAPPDEAHTDTRYNLACVFAQAGKPIEALEQLAQSFEHILGEDLRRQLDWMDEDPTLLPIKEEHAAAFDALIARLRKRIPPEKPPASGAGDWEVEVITVTGS